MRSSSTIYIIANILMYTILISTFFFIVRKQNTSSLPLSAHQMYIGYKYEYNSFIIDNPIIFLYY